MIYGFYSWDVHGDILGDNGYFFFPPGEGL